MTEQEKPKLNLFSLDKRVRELESEDNEELVIDLLYAVIEALVRTKSSGAWKTAEALKDKYLDPEIDVAQFGEGVVKTTDLLSARKAK